MDTGIPSTPRMNPLVVTVETNSLHATQNVLVKGRLLFGTDGQSLVAADAGEGARNSSDSARRAAADPPTSSMKTSSRLGRFTSIRRNGTREAISDMIRDGVDSVGKFEFDVSVAEQGLAALPRTPTRSPAVEGLPHRSAR